MLLLIAEEMINDVKTNDDEQSSVKSECSMHARDNVGW